MIFAGTKTEKRCTHFRYLHIHWRIIVYTLILALNNYHSEPEAKHFSDGHSAKSWEWETPAKNLESSVAIPSSEIPLFSNLSEFVGSCQEFVGSLSGVAGTCWEFVGTCRDLSGLVGTCRDLLGVTFGEALLVMGMTMCL